MTLHVNTARTDDIGDNLADWLSSRLAGHRYLLAHTERGVIWGRVVDRDGQLSLSTSADVFGAKLGRAELTLVDLIDLRLFGDTAELHLWHDGSDWQTTTTADAGLPKEQYIVEKQILWGTRAEDQKDGFTLLTDGSQGLRHAVPCPVDNQYFKGNHRPLRLVVRHYLTADAGVTLRISHSRLVDLEVN